MEKRAGRKASRLQKRREAAAMARKRRGRIIWGIFIAVVAVLLAFSGMYYVTDIEVADNARYTDEEIIDMTCDSPLAGNTLLFSKFKSRIILDDVPFMEYVDVAMKDNHTLLLRVKEKQLVGVLSFGGLDYYFDNTGTVVETADAAAYGEEKLVPRILGLDIKRVNYGETLEIDPAVLGTITATARMIKKYQIHPDYLDYDTEDNTVSLIYGDVQVLIGGDTLLEEKMSRVAAILPQLEGETGVLHMENFAEDTVNIVFVQTDWKDNVSVETDVEAGLAEEEPEAVIEPQVEITEEGISPETAGAIQENTEENYTEPAEKPAETTTETPAENPENTEGEAPAEQP